MALRVLRPNGTKLSLEGDLTPEQYRQTTNFQTKGLRSNRRRFACIFQVLNLSIRNFLVSELD